MMESFLATKYIVILGLIFNLIGTLLLSIPTVGGADYIKYIMIKIKRLSAYLKKHTLNFFYLLIFIVVIDLFIPLPSLFVSLFTVSPKEFEKLSLIELVSKAFSDGISFMAFFILTIIVISILICIFHYTEKMLMWLVVDKVIKKEREKRLGLLGVALLMFGFLLQLLQSILS